MWILLINLLVILLIVLIKRQYTYWARKGYPYEAPKFPYGNIPTVWRQKETFGSVVTKLYEKYRNNVEKFVGIYIFCRPSLIITDKELANRILTTEFNTFYDRGLNLDHNMDLFSLRGQKWKSLRSQLMPAFSSGKLKGMFGNVNDISNKMVEYLNKQLESTENKTIEMKDVLTTFAVDIVGSVIFGLEIDSFNDPNNEFRQVSYRAFNRSSFFENFISMSSFLLPPVVNFANCLGFEDPPIKALKQLVKYTIDFREKNNVVRKDLLQLMLQLRNDGKIIEENDDWSFKVVENEKKFLSSDMIASQSFLFYIAGSETTSATAAFTLHELSMYPEVLRRAQAEVDQCLKEHKLESSDMITYDALNDMKYLDLCMMETLRKYPGLPFLNRDCLKDYQIPDSKYVIEKGTHVIIPLYGIHHDPANFPDPYKYDPERHLRNDLGYDPIAYMPFGVGPKHCIAMRMGKINSKLAVAKILSKFNIAIRERKELEFIYTAAPALLPKDGIQLNLSKRI